VGAERLVGGERGTFRRRSIMPQWPFRRKEPSGMPDSRSLLEVFDNQYPQRDYKIEIVAPEFTSVCPKTGQPDYGTITIIYTPDKKCVELKSLKMYLQSYRNAGIFYENVTNAMMDDFTAVLQPRWMKIEAAFTPRGGISSKIIVQHASAV
jgi:7-cyano-7-deazaguanine reductase